MSDEIKVQRNCCFFLNISQENKESFCVQRKYEFLFGNIFKFYPSSVG